VTSFDHADIYGDYTTEQAFGKALNLSGINREDIQLISKCGIQLKNEERGTRIKHYNYNSSYIINQVEASLKNLKTDYLDLFLLHRPSPLMQTDEIAKAIDKLLKDGKIKSFGVSNFTPQQIDFLQKEVPVYANQIQCSLTHTQALENDTLFYHQQKDVLTMAWSPFGDVFKENINPALSQTLGEISEKHNCSIAQVALAWILKHPARVYPVVGTTKTKNIKDAVEALNIKLDLQDWFELFERARGKEVD
jgi:predicted oxidoreductase